MHAGLKRVIDHAQGAINWELKHFPLSSHNPAAAIEAETLECVKEHYGNRKAWLVLTEMIAQTQGNGRGVGDLSSFIDRLGLSQPKIEACIATDKYKLSINQQYADGIQAGINATPAIIVIDNWKNKKVLIRGYKSPEQLLHIIQKSIDPT